MVLRSMQLSSSTRIALTPPFGWFDKGLVLILGTPSNFRIPWSSKSCTRCFKTFQFSRECPTAPKWNSHVALGSKSLGGGPSYCLSTVGEIKFLCIKIGYSYVMGIGSCYNTLCSFLKLERLVSSVLGSPCLNQSLLVLYSYTVKVGRTCFCFPLFLLII